MANDDERADRGTCALSTEDQCWRPDCANRSAVEQGSKECDKKGCPRHCEQNPDRVDEGRLCGGDALDGDADGRLHCREGHNIHQDPDDVILHGLGVLPCVEVSFQSSKSDEAPVYCKSRNCCIDDLSTTSARVHGGTTD